MRDRIKRILILEPGSDEKEMERRIREVDRKRKEYYQYYTGNMGPGPEFHLCLDSGLTGVDGCLRAVLDLSGRTVGVKHGTKRYRAGGTDGSTGCGTGGSTGVFGQMKNQEEPRKDIFNKEAKFK